MRAAGLVDRVASIHVIKRAAVMSLVVLLPTTASAHPPYESRVRVVTDSDGHELEVVEVIRRRGVLHRPRETRVRHPRGNVAETDYGRAITVVCAFSSKCVVFRYDGLMPILRRTCGG